MPPVIRPFVCAALFAGALVSAVVAPGANAAQDPNYSPIAHGIDLVCNAYRPNAKPTDIVYLRRSIASDGTAAAWQRTPDDLDAFVQVSNAPPASDFATIVTDHGSVVSANVVHADSALFTRETRAWCYIGGKLSRTTIDLVDTKTSLGWRRTRYYGDDLDAPLVDWIAEESPTAQPMKPLKDAPTATLVVGTYATPDKLPFYDAYRAISAQKVPGKAPAMPH
jgi:hypothetical protein